MGVRGRISMSVTIRRANKDDLDQLTQLFKGLLDFHAALQPQLAMMPGAEQAWRASATSWLDDDTWCVFVAEVEDHLVGFIAGSAYQMPPVYPEKYHGYISDAFVAEPYRRHGVGEQLYGCVAAWFQERGLKIVELSAAAANPISRAFWHKMGFEDHMIRMRKELE